MMVRKEAAYETFLKLIGRQTMDKHKLREEKDE
jgi:hypothetical protein